MISPYCILNGHRYRMFRNRDDDGYVDVCVECGDTVKVKDDTEAKE